MKKNEVKYQNTAKKMNNALFRLLEKKEFNDITVSEICKEAGVNRSTFYAHYEDITELLQETHDKFMHSFLESFDDIKVDINDMEIKDASLLISPKYLVPYLEFIKENKNIFKLYMNRFFPYENNCFFEFFKNKVFIPICKKYDNTNENVIHYMTLYFLQGTAGIIMEWLDKDCKDDILSICEIIEICVRPNIH